MFIKRVCVEEGFLHRLDLHLGPGLTVLIGARGSGKTSIIELIRFCTDAPSYSSKGRDAARRQALAVLGTGKVTVTLDIDGRDLVLSRSAEEGSLRHSAELPFASPIILSQSEIEEIGLVAESRLRLVDGFVPSLRENERAEDACRALISSLTVELRNVNQDLAATHEQLARLVSVPEALEQARLEAAAAHKNLEKVSPQRQRLDAITVVLAPISVRLRLYDRIVAGISQWLRRLRDATSPQPLDTWPAAGGPDPLSLVRASLSEGEHLALTAAEAVALALAEVQKLQRDDQSQQVALEDEARTIRTAIDQVSEGAGALMKRVSDLEVMQQRSAALREHLASLVNRISGIEQRRAAELDRLDSLREARVNARESAASFLNHKLGPRIRVVVNRFGSVAPYVDVLTEALRGSGLQYNLLAPELAQVISPRELVEAVEANDPARIVRIANLAPDRAQRLVSHLRQVGVEHILTVPLGDTVGLSLLDGGTYKPTQELSVGQRCTVVLPIILSHNDRVLIVDQPEDNLDNSFIAETLVRALRNRSDNAQLVFATHNANVPVLGEADHVVFLTSDGRRGDVAHDGALDHPESVTAISDVMEGGRDAFARRAAFYATAPTVNEPL